MKNVRSLLFLVAAVFLISGLSSIAMAQKADDNSASLAYIDQSTFSASDSMTLELMEWDTTDIATPLHVGAKKEDYKVLQFYIRNDGHTPDTLESVAFRSFNDKDFSVSRIRFYQEGNSTPLWQDTMPGAFSENTPLVASGFNVPIDTVGGADDSLVFFFTFDSDSANVDTSYHSLYLGLKITQNVAVTSGVRMANAGYCPTVDSDTLAYDNAALGYGSGGRLVDFDTKPPELDRILFSLVDDVGGGCPGNGIINLGDSIYIRVADTTGAFELAIVKADLAIFGGTAATQFVDTIVYSTAPNPDDSAMSFGWRIPYTDFAGADEVSANFYWLVITAEDRSGNINIDSIPLPWDIDTEKPVFDDVVIGNDTVHVWMELSYDANGDSIAAVGDSLSFYSYLTSNPFNEVESVVIDLTGWGLGNIALDDQAGDRRFSTTIEIGPGAIDLPAEDTLTIYYVTAYDNACNSATDSAYSTYDIDNDIPGPPDDIVYNRLTDNDANNIVNIGDEIIVEVDASSTDDLDTITCGVSVDLLNSGLGGSPVACMDSSGGLFTLEAMVYDGGIHAVDEGANSHYITITMTDDAGNTAEYDSDDVLYPDGKMELPIDTEAPPGVEDLEVTLGPCAMNLTWTGDADDSLYLVFWDGGDGFDTADYEIDTVFGVEVYNFKDTLGATSDTTWWTTDATISLEHGTTYQFVVRTIDNANNREYNFDRASNTADCVAPVACIEYPEVDGGSYGTGNELEIIAETSDGDIDFVRLWIRDADVGSGTPGDLKDFGAMTAEGGGVFTYTIDSLAMRDYFDCVDWHYEAVVQCTDTVGNVRSVPDILADCDYTTFEFDWFCAPLPLALISVNDAVTPQSGCGFDVTRDDQNTVEINVTDHTAGDTYVVDVNVIIDWQYTRVYYNDTVSTMPFTFPLDATLFPKGTQEMWVEVTRDDGNSNRISADLCVPDEDAPMAYIYAPTDGQWVRKSCTFMSMIEVWAVIDTSLSYDFGGTSKVEFYESADGETWSLFDVATGTSGGFWKAEWDNCAYEHGDAAYLRAIFYDDANNTYTTAHITVYIDGEAPDITLTMDPSQMLCDDTMATIGGYVDLVATVNTVWEDIDEVYFIYAPADSPDIPSFYRLIGTGEPSTKSDVYKYYDFDTENLVDGKTYRFRAIARDITGNTMWDYNGDGNMDAYTFDPINKNSDAMFMIDNTPVTAAFGHAVITDGDTTWHEFPTPSDKLNGADRIYAVQGMDVTLHTWTIPMNDTCCYEKVVYMVDGDEVAVSYGPPPFEVTFNPYDMHLFDPEDLNDDGYDELDLGLVFYDCFGRTNTDSMALYILNNEANPVVFSNPVNNECVAGEVDLEVLAINDYDVREVFYFWRESAEDDWIPVGSSTDDDEDYEVTWYTVNAGVEDGQVQLGAIAEDWAGNMSEPAVITVTVANTPPMAEIIAPADMSYIGDTALVEADVTSGEAVKMFFLYKSHTDESWMKFSQDFHEPWVADFDPDPSDGWYHIRVKPYNCADVWSYSETITVWYDGTDPRARLTSVAGYDAGTGDLDIDVTGMRTVTVTGYFADDRFEGGGSGLAKVGFWLMNDDEDRVREIILDVTDDGYYSAKFDISGLGIGEYVFQAGALDAVGNDGNSQTVSVYITDQDAPIVALAGYHDSTLYAYDWSGDAEAILFQLQDGEEWVGLGIAEETCLDRLWAAEWIPTAGTHTIRVISSDDGDNFNDTSALTATFVYNSESNFNFGTSNITLEIKKNHMSGDISGNVKTESVNGMPVVIALYDDGSVNCQKVSLDQNQQNPDLYMGSWNAGSMYDGAARIFSSHPNAGGTAIEIVHTGFVVHEILPDFGTNGYVEDIMGEVTLDVPPGAVDDDMYVLIMETWIPEAGIDQDHFSVVTNPNGYGWYFGCNDYYGSNPEGKTVGSDATALNGYYCCFNDNKYGVIKMYYDPEEDTPAESLAVAWWDSYDNEWCFEDIKYPAYVEGFNTEDNYVEFGVECLHGLYAVVSYRTPSHPGPIAIEWVDISHCGYYDPMPTFKLKVKDMSINNSDIDPSTFQMWVDGSPIVEDGEPGEWYWYDYDHVTNNLWIWWYGWYYDEYYYDSALVYSDPLDCGDHAFKIGVKNMQGQYAEEEFTFSVDCAPPDVVFDNYYVGKNPTIRFYVTDEMSGVDTSSIHVDVISVGSNDTDPYNPDQDEYFRFVQTFFPEQITIQEDGLVELPTVYDLEHKRAIIVIIYDGVRTGIGDPFGDDDYYDGGYGNINWDDYYSDHHGIHDCVGNVQTPVVQLLTIDNMAPTLWVVGYDKPGDMIDALPGGCVEIQIMDDGGGFDEDGIMIYEDGEEIDEGTLGELEEGEYAFDEDRNIIEYCPTPGARIEVVVIDNSGNVATRRFGTGDPTQIFNAIVDYNPWDPGMHASNRITIDFTGPATLSIYDFGGDLVKTMRETDGVFEWNGMTEDGTRVADGIYFGHIKVDTSSGSYFTVVKIAIVEK